MLEELDDSGNEGDQDDGDDDDGEVILDEGDVPEEVAAEGEDRHPADPANDVVADELQIAHPADAGHERREGADDRNEPGDDDGLGPVFLIEFMRPVEIFFPEEARFLLVKDLGPDDLADPVVDGVADDRGRGQDEEKPSDLQVASGGECPGGKDQRISGKEGCHDQAGLAEDDNKENKIGPEAIRLDQIAQVRVQVDDEIDDLGQKFHAGSLIRVKQDYTDLKASVKKTRLTQNCR